MEVWVMHQEQVAKQCAENLLQASIIAEDEVEAIVAQCFKLNPKDLLATLIESHYLLEALNDKYNQVYRLN